MSYLSEKREEHEKKCEQAVRRKDWGSAKFHAAKTAEFSLKLAEQTDGKVARRYIEDAFGWIETAENIAKNKVVEPTPAGRSGKETDEGAGDDTSEWLVSEKPQVSMDDIAGMDDAKRLIRDMILEPIKNPEAAEKWGIRKGGGILMFGPPGNGKTTIAKAIANELDCPFYLVTGAGIRSKWSGEAEKRLRQVLQEAKSHPMAILFIDDLDGLLPRRGGNSVVDNRVVCEFLSEVGGFGESENTLLLLGATNSPWEIDDAVFRTGRFDEKLFVGLPDLPAREGILRRQLEEVPLADEVDLHQVAETLDGYTGSDIVGITSSCKRAGFSRQVEGKEAVVTLSDIEEAMERIPKSATEKLMRRYEKFQKERKTTTT